MKIIRRSFMILIVIGLFVGVASAQEFVGTFTLPCEVQWDQAVLPAGNYTLIQNSARLPDYTTIRSEKGTIVVKYLSHSSGADRTGQSTLTLVRKQGRHVVSSLRLAEVGTEFSYLQPRSEQLMAQGPVLIQRIPISARGK